ncbi:MAG TPA: polyprenyl synthetase family protein [Bacteroidota bacterium]|nr:polyprenyl synthetase family protein [Bacteroidota bacterium]
MHDRDFQKVYNQYKKEIGQRFRELTRRPEPASVYDPIRYALGTGGKRVRAVLVLLACEAVGGKRGRAVDAAVAIEMLHNFTLVHDDIMDNAPLRRNRQSVHAKWDANVAILAGDGMISLAYRSLLGTRAKKLREVLGAFTSAFIEVCEGQGFDKEFELRHDVRVADYLMMIGKKTAHIIAAATEIGALIGSGTRRQVYALRTYGKHLGIAFQIKDDLLDIAGDAEELGKKIGGDITAGKKTFLLLNGLERTRGKERVFLRSLMAGSGGDRTDVERARNIYEHTGTLEAAGKAIERSTRAAQQALSSLRPSRAREMLIWLSDQLLERSH